MNLRYVKLATVLLIAHSSYSQSINPGMSSFVSEADRQMLVKSNIPLTDWHEKTFWLQYYDYRDRMVNVSLRAYQSLTDLAKTTRSSSASDAYDISHEMLDARFHELEVREEYYSEIARDHNGAVAMKFIQTEFLLDLLESWRLYEATPMKNYRFLPVGLSPAEYNQIKYNLLSKSLALSPEEATVFFPIYTRYEQECNDELGIQYDLYELYSGEPGDLPPGVAKRQGAYLLTLMARELRLKQKYFNELDTALGSTLAARFLAWEDYYSVGCKLAAWQDEDFSRIDDRLVAQH